MTQVMVERKVENLKCQFDFRPLKVGNRLELCECMKNFTYCWKDLNEDYNFV